jgi:hypothetical protein
LRSVHCVFQVYSKNMRNYSGPAFAYSECPSCAGFPAAPEGDLRTVGRAIAPQQRTCPATIKFEDGGVMNESVDGSDSHGLVSEDRIPIS